MTPRSEEQFKQMRSESKARIVNAALQLFAEKGFQSTSIEAIAKKAGVSKGLVYNYFTSKDDLLEYSMMEVFRHTENGLSEILSIRDPVAQVHHFIDGMFDYVTEHIEFWRLQMNIMMQPEIPKKLRDSIMSKLHDYIHLFAGIFKTAGVDDAEGEGWMLAASLDGVLMYYLFSPDKCPVDEIRTVMKRHYKKVLKSD